MRSRDECSWWEITNVDAMSVVVEHELSRGCRPFVLNETGVFMLYSQKGLASSERVTD